MGKHGSKVADGPTAQITSVGVPISTCASVALPLLKERVKAQVVMPPEAVMEKPPVPAVGCKDSTGGQLD